MSEALRLVWTNGATVTKSGRRQNPKKEQAAREEQRQEEPKFIKIRLSVALWIIGILLPATGYLIYHLAETRTSLSNLNTAINHGDDSIRSRLSKMEPMLASLHGTVQAMLLLQYGQRLSAEGFEAKESRLAAVTTADTKDISRLIYQKQQANDTLNVTILRVTPEEIVVSIWGKVGTVNLGKTPEMGNQIIVPVVPGQTRLLATINRRQIFLTVLDRPTLDSAILAVGPKQSTPPHQLN